MKHETKDNVITIVLIFGLAISLFGILSVIVKTFYIYDDWLRGHIQFVKDIPNDIALIIILLGIPIVVISLILKTFNVPGDNFRL